MLDISVCCFYFFLLILAHGKFDEGDEVAFFVEDIDAGDEAYEEAVEEDNS